MNYLYYNFIIALSLTALTTFFLGVFVLIKNRKNIVNRSFAFYSFSIAWWSFSQVWMIGCNKKLTALVWCRIMHFGVFLIPVLFIHFIVSLLNIKGKKLLFIITYSFSILFAILSFTRYSVIGVEPKLDINYAKYFAIPGFAYYLSVLYFIIVIVYGLNKLYKTYRVSAGVKQNQLKYLFWSSLFGYIGGGANFFLSYGISIPFLNPFGTYAVPFYAVVMTYAIFKHQLMDINIVLKKGLIYSILIAFITAIYLIFVILIERLLHQFIGYSSIIASILAAFAIALFFTPLKNYIQSFIDKLFFKGTLDTLAQEKELMQEELIRSERLKAVATLAAGMAHEIKNPLTAIKTFTEHLRAKKDDPEFIEKFERIVGGEVDKINHTVHQLLDFAKPIPLKLEETNLNQLLDDTLSLLNNDIIKHKIKLTKEYAQLPTIQADKNQLKQAFLNLLLNAIEAMPNAGELKVITKDLGARSQDIGKNKIEVIIQDTGIGIPQKDLPHIFDPFYSTKDKGTGLGLSITYEIIKKHNGNISIESMLGKTTLVRIIF